MIEQLEAPEQAEEHVPSTPNWQVRGLIVVAFLMGLAGGVFIGLEWPRP